MCDASHNLLACAGALVRAQLRVVWATEGPALRGCRRDAPSLPGAQGIKEFLFLLRLGAVDEAFLSS
jgi:hypothetical protein